MNLIERNATRYSIINYVLVQSIEFIFLFLNIILNYYCVLSFCLVNLMKSSKYIFFFAFHTLYITTIVIIMII